MKLLLTTLNSKYVHSNLAIRYLYNVVANSPFDVTLKEYTINNERDYVFNEIIRGDYDIVCFSCYIWNIEQINTLIEDLRDAAPNIVIIVGGPEVSYDTLDYMKDNPCVDFVLRGEGEITFYKLLKSIYMEDYSFKYIDGLGYRIGGSIHVNEEGEPVDFNEIPFPYETIDFDKDKVIYYESVRGCPYNCTYCLSSIDKKIRPLNVNRVRRDIGYFLMKNVKQVKFIDRTFNYYRQRALKIWEFLINNDNGITNFHFEINGDLLNDEAVEMLSHARPGMFQLEIGIQSTNPKTLRAVNRRENIYPLMYYVKKIIEMGNIHVHVDLIAGLPYEDYNSFANSFNTVYGLNADCLQLGFLKMLKGTEIREEAGKYGYRFRENAPYEVISNDFMSSVDIVKLKMVEKVFELYGNRGGFENSVAFLMRKLGCTPFNFFERLADFYYAKGYQDRSHSKENLYRILYEFADKIYDEINKRDEMIIAYASSIMEQRGYEREPKKKETGLVAFKSVINTDMLNSLNKEAVKKFDRKGWDVR
jgi:radical SAM superfamily enzyme YgiQ (UPF0313 family)